jgi:hypothetical protein
MITIGWVKPDTFYYTFDVLPNYQFKVKSDGDAPVYEIWEQGKPLYNNLSNVEFLKRATPIIEKRNSAHL